jgi:hypothetical protein
LIWRADLPYFYSDQYDLGMEYIGHAPQSSYQQLVAPVGHVVAARAEQPLDPIEGVPELAMLAQHHQHRGEQSLLAQPREDPFFLDIDVSAQRRDRSA